MKNSSLKFEVRTRASNKNETIIAVKQRVKEDENIYLSAGTIMLRTNVAKEFLMYIDLGNRARNAMIQQEQELKDKIEYNELREKLEQIQKGE